MISLVKIDVKKKFGYFRSYRDIGKFLARNGETGKYYAIPKNIKTIAGIKEINVTKYWDKKIHYSKTDSYCYLDSSATYICMSLDSRLSGPISIGPTLKNILVNHLLHYLIFIFTCGYHVMHMIILIIFIWENR